MQLSQRYRIQDLSTHKVLIRKANEHLLFDKSEQHIKLVEDFEKLVDLFESIMIEKSRYIEKSVTLNQKLLSQKIFGSEGQQEEGLLHFISESILETSKCEDILGGKCDNDILEAYDTSDLDQLIRDRFVLKTRNRIHYKVLEYLYKSTQVLIHDHQQEFILDIDLLASGDETLIKQQRETKKKNLVALLRFIDCLTWDSSAVHDEIRCLSSLRKEYTAAIIKVVNHFDDLQVIKLGAMVLANSITLKSFPTDDSSANLFRKFIFLSKIGESLHQETLKDGASIDDIIKKVQSETKIRFDLLQRSDSKSKAPEFNFLSDDSNLWIESEQSEEDSEANRSFLQGLANTQGQADAKPQAKGKKIDYAILNFQFGNIEEFIQKKQAQIKADEEAKRASDMQIDQGDKTLQDKIVQASLKDIATTMFSEKYDETVEAWQKQYGRSSSATETPLSLESFKKEHPLKYSEAITELQMKLLVARSSQCVFSLYHVILCSISAMKRVIWAETRVAWDKNFSKELHEKIKHIFDQSAISWLILALKSSKKLNSQQLEQQKSIFVSLSEAVKSNLARVKDLRGSASLQKSYYYSELMTQKEDQYTNCLLVDTLAQISSIKLQTNPETQSTEMIIEQKNGFINEELLMDHRFQSQIWLITQHSYEILSGAIRHSMASANDFHVKIQKLRKDIEEQAQKTLLKPILVDSKRDCLWFAHHLDVLRLIIHVFIRSAWVLEGIAPPAAGQEQSQGPKNLESLVDLTESIYNAFQKKCYYFTQSAPQNQERPIKSDDIVLIFHFLIRRLTIDNRSPAHPTAYDQMIIQSKIFKDEIFGKIMSESLNQPGQDRCALSKLKVALISCIGSICSNDPTQIPKAIELGLLPKISQSVQQAIPVHRRSMYVLFDFLRVIVVHEKGREFVKETGLFKFLQMPQTSPKTDGDRDGEEGDENNLSFVILSSNQEKHKLHANLAMASIIRSSDEYFQDACKRSTQESLNFIIPKAKKLQEIYYAMQKEALSDKSMSKRQFMIQATSKLMSLTDYHVIKFEVEKLHTLCYSSHHDAISMMPFLLKVFDQDGLKKLFEVFEILATIKPIYDFVQGGSATDRQGSPLSLFSEIFKVLISQNREGVGKTAIEFFENRLRASCASLSPLIEILKSEEETAKEKDIDLVAFFQHSRNENKELPNDHDFKVSTQSISKMNVRGHLIATILIIGQYISVFEFLRKITQEILCLTKSWASEIRILSNFLSMFNECNHKITDEFFVEQEKFIEKGVITAEQIKQISINFKQDQTAADKEVFHTNRKQIEENIDMYRDNLTYIDQEYINIQRLLQIVWEYWRAGVSSRHGHSSEQVIIENKRAFTEMTIENILNLNKVIDKLEGHSGDLNSTEFLTSISRLYTFISELSQMIPNDKLSGITFYKFYEKQCLSRLIKIFNICKNISIQKFKNASDSSGQIKMISVDCIQSINKQLKAVMLHFISCSQSLIASQSPSITEIIKDEGLYDSPQHFFANYFYQLVYLLVIEEQEKNSSLQNPDDIKIELYEDKNLREVQLQLLTSIATGFEKCKFLKDEHGKPNSSNDTAAEKKPSKPIKPHHDESLISQITGMGFDRSIAKKALKVTGDVSNAVTFLLEAGNLDNVSDSDDPANADAKKAAEEKLAKEEAAKKQQDEERKSRQGSLISVENFKEFMKQAQEKGLEAIQNWSTFSIEELESVPFKTQRKYEKLFDQYIMSLVRSPNQSQDNLTVIFDKIFGLYEGSVNKLKDLILSKSQDGSVTLPEFSILVQKTKNFLSLLHRMTKIETYEKVLRNNRKDSLEKMIEAVVVTLNSLTSNNQLVEMLQKLCTNKTSSSDQMQCFICLSNTFELMYRSQLLLLVYNQTLVGKKNKYDAQILEQEKKGAQASLSTSKSPQQKRDNLLKKLASLPSKSIAMNSLRFLETFKQSNFLNTMPRKYTSDLSVLNGQIHDISRAIYLIQNKDETSPHLDILNKDESAQDPKDQLLIYNPSDQQASLTSASSIYNIIQVQRLAYDEHKVQKQMENLILKMIQVKAQKVAEYNHLKSKKESKQSSLQPSEVKIQQKDSLIDFNSFATEFQTQVLGIGKINVPAQQRDRWGAQAPGQVYLSQPSNEVANKQLISVFKKAITKVCDLVVTKPKHIKQSETDKAAAEKELKEALMKASNQKDALKHSKLQLKESFVKQINDGPQQPQPPKSNPFLQKDQNPTIKNPFTENKDEIKEQKAQKNETLIYESIFNSLKKSSESWQQEITTFTNLQSTDSGKLKKIETTEVDDSSQVALEQWQDMSLIELRNLSSLARVYINSKCQIVQEIIDSNQGEQSHIQDKDVLSWFRQVYLPMRLLKRCIKKQEQPKDADQSPEKYDIWYEIESTRAIEKLDKNICLFLNELTGYGHLYSEEAVTQRKQIRERLLLDCLKSLDGMSAKASFDKMTIFEQSQIASNLIIIQHLINQFNQHEYNRVILSKDCYQWSLRMLFEHSHKNSSSQKFVQVVNQILSQMVKTPTPSQNSDKKKDGKNKTREYSLSTILIERALKIFNIIALFIEGEKKRDKQLKALNKKKKELQLQEKQKKKSEEDKKKKADSKPSDAPPDAQENQQMASSDNGPQPNNTEDKSPDVALPEDIQMNGDSEEDDDDAHGEGSLSQQQDLNQLQPEHGQAVPGEEDAEVNDYGDDEDVHEYDQDHLIEEDNIVNEDEGIDEEDDNLDDDMDGHQMVIEHDPGVQMMAEEDEEEEDMMEEGHEDEDMGEYDEEEEFDDDIDDLPNEDDLGLMFAGFRGPPRHRNDRQQEARDILFQDPAQQNAPQRPSYIFENRAHLLLDHSNPQDQGDYGPNWSQEEEEVSQALRNLRGLAEFNQTEAPRHGLSHLQHGLVPRGNGQPDNNRYSIELDVCPAPSAQNNQKDVKMSIEQIKQEQLKAKNNQISQIFQIIKPIDIHGQCLVAQQIDQEFLKGVKQREDFVVEQEKKAKKLALANGLNQNGPRPNQVLEDDTDEEEPQSVNPPLSHEYVPNAHGGGMHIFRGDGPGGQFSRLLEMGMDIERLLQAGLHGINDPILEAEDMLGGPMAFLGGQPMGLRRDNERDFQRQRERVAQANVQRDVRDLSVNWDSSLPRVAESTHQDNTQTVMEALFQDEGLVIEIPEPVENLEPVSQEESKSSQENVQNQAAQSSANEGEMPAHLRNISEMVAGLQVNQPSNPPVQPAAQDDAAEALNQFFSSMAQPAEQNPSQPQPVPPTQEQSQAQAQPEPPVQNQEQPQPDQNTDAINDGMASINQAIEQIRDELPKVEEPKIEEEKKDEQLPVQNQEDVPQPSSLIEEVQPSSLIEEVQPSSLIEQVENADNKNQEPAQHQNANDLQQPESSSLEQQPQPQPAAEVEMTFGFPNALLLENDIEPAMLNELPEDLRAEILSTVQSQFEEWQRQQAQQVQADSAQPVPEQQQPVAETNADQPPAENQVNAQASPEQPAQENNAQQAQQPAAPVNEEPVDPEVAQAIAMGLDPDFIANIPPEMRRELMQNESFRAANTGVPIPPQRAPEPMDFASIIATAQDPMIRREMLQNLSQEQVDTLPHALRAEAINVRRGRPPGGMMYNPGFDDAPHPPPRSIQQMMGASREELERQMGVFLQRHGVPAEADPFKQELGNPKDMAFDQLMIEYCADCDQKLQDEVLNKDGPDNIIVLVQQELFESTSQANQIESGSIVNTNIDQLLKNVLITICLNSNVKTDLIQLLRLLLKYKQNSVYPCRNKVVNALTIIMKISAVRDQKSLLTLLGIPMPHEQSKVQISDMEWNKIFLSVVGVLRVLIDNNKKLILHMLRCLLKPEEFHTNKSENVLNTQLEVENTNALGAQRPPLALIIQMMRELSEEHHNLQKNKQLTDEQKQNSKSLLVRIRNIKNLIQDAFKQFDLLFKELDIQMASGKANKDQIGIDLGELSIDSVKSLTDLLYLPQIDKRLLSALGDFMFRLSNLSIKNETPEKNQEKNQRNWSLIQQQCQHIGNKNARDLNELLLEALMNFGMFDNQIAQLDLTKVPSQLERALSQKSAGNDNRDSSMGLNSDGGPGLERQTSIAKQKMNPEQEEQLKVILDRFEQESAPIKHILSLNCFFFSKFSEEKKNLQETQSGLKMYEKDMPEDAPEKPKEPEQNKDESNKAMSGDQSSESKKAEEKVDKEKKNALKKIKEEIVQINGDIAQKDSFVQEIKSFLKSDEIMMLIQQINKMLVIIQQSGDENLPNATKSLVNLVFDCFMPEMQSEVIESSKAKKAKGKNDKPNDPASLEDDSEFVKMETIEKIASKEVQPTEDAAMEGSNDKETNAGDKQIANSSKRKTLVFRDIDDATDRLFLFNNFCLQNQSILNKLVKAIYGGNQREREKDSKAKDMATISEYIKFMPNLLDFENKRIYFKKELKKMKRSVNARPLVLMIRRKEIFMDAYSQLHYLTPNELKGKISVEFSGERGQDVGGLTRDFFIDLSREMFNQNFGLFKHSDNGSSYMPNPKSYVQGDHLSFFKFIGRVIGKALLENCNLECYFVRSMYKMMIGQKLNFKDLEDYDNNLYNGLDWCLQPGNDVEALYECFSTQLDFFGKTEEIDLIPNGRNIDVTDENKELYCERKAYYHLYKSVQKQIDAFLQGFHEIIPKDLISIFTYKELELLISGLPDYQIADLKAHTNYHGYTVNSPQIIWFWEIMETLDRTEKGNFLQFVTGSSKVPVEGFSMLQGMNGPENFQITRVQTSDIMRLPQGHTCFNQLDLPEYPSKEVLQERLMWAIKECSGFGFA